MRKLLLVIDVQNSFINEHTEKVAKDILTIINSKNFDDVVFTKFINEKNSRWYKELNYRGCLSKEKSNLFIDNNNYLVFEKKIYSAYSKKLEKYLIDNKIDVIYLCGLDTDACVLKTALDLFENNYKIKVLKKYCASHSGKRYHNYAIELLEKLIGKNNIK